MKYPRHLKHLPVLQPDGGETSAPDAAGIHGDGALPDPKPQRRPVPEDHQMVAVASGRRFEPGVAAVGGGFRRTGVLVAGPSVVVEEADPVDTREGDEETRKLVAVSADSIIGREIEIASSTIDLQSAARSFMRSFTPPSKIPLKERMAKKGQPLGTNQYIPHHR